MFFPSLGYRRSGRQFDEDEVYVGSSTTQQGKLTLLSLTNPNGDIIFV